MRKKKYIHNIIYTIIILCFLFLVHLHFLEDINYNNIHYLTGGAVCANWWKGKRFGMEEGFLRITVTGDKFNWEYIDFGWEPTGK